MNRGGSIPISSQLTNADTVNGFHASQTPGPNLIPVADSSGILSPSWLPNGIREFENPIDLTDATSDYFLQVGEVAKISFSNATLVPLHIATQDGTYYELHLIPSNTGGTSGATGNVIYLNPNNTTYSNAFVYIQSFVNATGYTGTSFTYNAFRIGYAWSSVVVYITNRTIYKNVKGIVDVYGLSDEYPGLRVFTTDWRDTTTPWTSLGTVVFPQLSSGIILVRRLM